ncbi:hypothetical protein MKEN_00867900 [Mycena kentingensis (nom. inval.)]|nr:hypothetical protein MKEN_00867900 [Mycena kentingensis (nom. inval.)]
MLIIEFEQSSAALSSLLHALRLPAPKQLFIHEEIEAPDPEDSLDRLGSVLNSFGCQLDRLYIGSDSLSVEECREALPSFVCPIAAHIEVTRDYTLDPRVWGNWNEHHL